MGPSDALPQFRPALGLVRAAAMPGPRASTSYDDDGQSEHGCGLLGCQSAEETHLNQAGLSRIMARQLIQGVINSNREKGQQYFEPNESTSQAFARLCQGGVVSSQLGHAEYRDGAHASGSGKDCGEIAGRETRPTVWIGENRAEFLRDEEQKFLRADNKADQAALLPSMHGNFATGSTRFVLG